MLQRFGKLFAVQKLKRDIIGIQELNQMNRNLADKSRITFDENMDYPCRICGHTHNSIFLEKYGYIYLLCEGCGAIYLANLPDTQGLYDAVDKEGTYQQAYLDEAFYQKRIELIAKPKAEFVLDCIEKKKVRGGASHEWVDIGCGVGEILGYIQQQENWIAQGIEANAGEISFARRMGIKNILQAFVDYTGAMLPMVQKLLTEATVVSLFNTVEHLNQPTKVLRCIAEKMQVGSYLVLEVPRHPSLASFACMAFSDFGYRHITPPQHLQIFTDQALRFMLGDRFSIVGEWKYGEGYLDLLSGAVLTQAESVPMVELYQKLAGITNQVQQTVDANGFADFVLLVARKEK